MIFSSGVILYYKRYEIKLYSKNVYTTYITNI